MRHDLLCRSLQHCVGQGVLIHLHCFNSKPKVVKKWLEAFPNTYFGFTKMVGDFTGEYARAVQELHESRLLVETDDPYFHFNQNRHSTPAVIGMAARELARIRGSDWRAILNVTRANAKRLYGERRPPALD